MATIYIVVIPHECSDEVLGYFKTTCETLYLLLRLSHRKLTTAL